MIIITVDAVYLASMFDHQGGVFISKTINKIPPIYRLDIIFTNLNPKVFHEFRDKLNYLGSIRLDGNSWRWVVSSTASFDILMAIKSHLRLKNEQVELALRFLNTIEQTIGRKPRIKPEVLRVREYCYQKMKKLKKLRYAEGGTND